MRDTVPGAGYTKYTFSDVPSRALALAVPGPPIPLFDVEGVPVPPDGGGGDLIILES